MSTKPVVTLVTCDQFPNLDPDEVDLPDALRDRGVEPRIAIWDDPSVDWSDAGVVVVRSVRDYALKRQQWLDWVGTVPRILNSPDILRWNTDKHYLKDLAERGLPVIPTTWLEPGMGLSKHQVHTRFPASGDFVVKRAIASGGRGTGRYTSTDARSRSQAINHAVRELDKGRTVMVQRYLESIERQGEISLIYLNGLPEYTVEKDPMLHPRYRADETITEEVARAREGTEEEWRWGEKIRKALHGFIRDRQGRDELLLFLRVDVVPDGQGGFYTMEVSLIDGKLYLQDVPGATELFADAIAVRAFW